MFLELIRDAMAADGAVSARRMFGGAGIFSGGVMFALVADGVLYLKTDDEGRAAFESEGLERFVYHRKMRPVALSYWRAPERLLDDPDEMRLWAGRALDVARRAKEQERPASRA